MTDPTEDTYFTSSYSGGNGDCVAVSFTQLDTTDEVLLRHSKHPQVPPMRFTRQEWNAFLAGAAAGEFTLPR